MMDSLFFFILSLEKYCFQFFPGRQRKTFQMGKSNTFDMICISMFFHKGNVPLIWHVWRQVTCKSFDTSYLPSIYFYSYLSKKISHSNLTPLLSISCVELKLNNFFTYFLVLKRNYWMFFLLIKGPNKQAKWFYASNFLFEFLIN